MEAPEDMANNVNSTGLTLTVKVTGVVGPTVGPSYSRFCSNYQYIGLTGKITRKTVFFINVNASTFI